MRYVWLLSIAVALIVGAFALVFAADLRSWPAKLDHDALHVEASPETSVRLTAPTMLPAGLSRRVLGVDRDQDWLRGLGAFARAYRSTAKLRSLDPHAYARLRAADTAVEKLTSDPNPIRAAQAYDLLAALTFREAIPGTGVVHGLVQNTLTDLQNALRLNPDDETARENMELVLRYSVIAIPPDTRQSRGLGRHADRYPKGGYAGPPGAGY